MREKDDPQNIKERPDLYEDLLKYADLGIEQSGSVFTRDCLLNIKKTIQEKMLTQEKQRSDT